MTTKTDPKEIIEILKKTSTTTMWWQIGITIISILIAALSLYGAFTARLADIEAKIENLQGLPSEMTKTQMGLVQFAASQGVIMDLDDFTVSTEVVSDEE